MLTRRKFITTAAATGLGATGVLTVHSFRKGSSEYEQAAKKIWRHGERASNEASDVMRELVRYAILAPSSHNTQHVRSSAGIAVFVSEREDKNHWIEVGRAFQRFALQATTMDVRTAHINQPVEVASLRPQFAKSIGISTGRPDLVIRFGRGPEMPRSLRRPIEAVLL